MDSVNVYLAPILCQFKAQSRCVWAEGRCLCLLFWSHISRIERNSCLCLSLAALSLPSKQGWSGIDLAVDRKLVVLVVWVETMTFALARLRVWNGVGPGSLPRK